MTHKSWYIVHYIETSNKLSVDPVVFAAQFIALVALIVLSVCWIVLRICSKRQCCCPRVWRSKFWLIFFCYDCFTYDAEGKYFHSSFAINRENFAEPFICKFSRLIKNCKHLNIKIKHAKITLFMVYTV